MHLKTSDSWQRLLLGLGSAREKLRPSVAAGMDHAVFSFRKHWLKVIKTRVTVKNRNGITQPRRWWVNKAKQSRIEDLQASVEIRSNAAVALEEGATIRPRSGSYLSIPIEGAKGLWSASGKLNKRVATPSKARDRGWKLIEVQDRVTRALTLYRVMGLTKTGKQGKRYDFYPVFSMIRQATIKPKLRMHEELIKEQPRLNALIQAKILKGLKTLAS